MTTDARFEDGAERPLRLVARDATDLEVISSLVQDAVFPITEMTWNRGQRRFALLLNRFRWEDAPAAAQRGRRYERVQAVVSIEDVTAVQTQGLDRSDTEMVLSLMSIDYAPAEDGTGRLTLTLAGDGAIAVETEALEVMLRDVTRPYIAPSGRVPDHKL